MSELSSSNEVDSEFDLEIVEDSVTQKSLPPMPVNEVHNEQRKEEHVDPFENVDLTKIASATASSTARDADFDDEEEDEFGSEKPQAPSSPPPQASQPEEPERKSRVRFAATEEVRVFTPPSPSADRALSVAVDEEDAEFELHLNSPSNLPSPILLPSPKVTKEDTSSAPGASSDTHGSESDHVSEFTDISLVAPTHEGENSKQGGQQNAESSSVLSSGSAKDPQVPAAPSDPLSEEKRREQERVLMEQAEKEWKDVEEMRGQDMSGTLSGASASANANMRMGYEDSLAYFASLDWSDEQKRVTVDQPPRDCCSNLFACFGPGPNLASPALNSERQLLFCIALKKFAHENEYHQRMAMTIYRRLSGDILPVGIIGSHWETIGFQGKDMATDLRGVGMLGLLHMLFFLSREPMMVHEIYTLSRDSKKEFPFAICSLNITKLVLECIRERLLTSTINSRNKVLDVAGEFYMALFWEFFNMWKVEPLQGPQDITRFQAVYKALGVKARANAAKFLTDFEQIRLKKRTDVSKKLGDTKDMKMEDFAEIE